MFSAAHLRGPTDSDVRRLLVLNWRDSWHPEGGGSELYVREVVERLAVDDCEVTLFTARYPGSRRAETINGVRYVRRGGHMTVYLWAALLILLRRFGRIDQVLEVQNGMPFLATAFTTAPTVVLVHHVHREQWPVVGPVLARVGWFLESRAAVSLNRRNRYLAVSQVTRAELISLGVDPDRISVAYNGLPSVPKFDHHETSLRPTVTVLSRLVPHKQIEHVIAIMPGLLEVHPHAQLHVIGSGWWDDHLTQLAQDLGVASQVTFFGHVSDERKFQLLTESWVHVLPSLKEGWGLSIMEAASVGVPSIAYRDAGGVCESILEGVTGLLANDQVELAAHVEQLLTHPEQRERLGRQAADRSAQFTWESTAAMVKKVLGEVSG